MEIVGYHTITLKLGSGFTLGKSAVIIVLWQQEHFSDLK